MGVMLGYARGPRYGFEAAIDPTPAGHTLGGARIPGMTWIAQARCVPRGGPTAVDLGVPDCGRPGRSA
jgi:hypothetical protein